MDSIKRERIMKREEKQNTKKAKYEKPVLTKYKKLIEVVAFSVIKKGEV